ncbi:MAG: NADH-quinone oxidoreductase subunit NuoH [Chloroflexota bacterium]|jgi:NADH-quinone oxidoreductase subunit H
MSFDIIEFLKRLVQLDTANYMREVWAETMPTWLSEGIIDLVQILVICTFLLVVTLGLIWILRKVVARIQDRVGPNRVGGRFGLLQTVADAMKLLTKEDITPAGADKLAFNLAPLIVVIAALMMWAVIPFAPGAIGTDIDSAVFYVLAISSVSVVSLLLAGWGSNNKYALLGAFRAVAQLVSYEVPMVMALIIPVLLAGTMSTQGIVEAQSVWYIVAVPLSALIFLISALAELGQTPFDLLEADSEIVAGYHIEYSGMKFAMFFLAEFINALFMGALFSTIYLGGWRGPGAEQYPLLGLIYFLIKTFFMYFVFVWIRGTLPRVRIDQLLNFNWKFLVPITLSLILVIAVAVKLLPEGTGDWVRAGVLLLINIGFALVVLEIMRRTARRRRQEVEASQISSSRSSLSQAAAGGD